MNRSRRIFRLSPLTLLASGLLASQGAAAPLAPARTPRIQVAILLDTSSSMDGLIDQARNQLWQVVDTFGKARQGNLAPTLEVAVLEYGNSGLSAQSGFVRQVAGLTTDLDRVSEALFALTTNGGDEYCGYAIDVATRELQWSSAKEDIRAIFIAGNEPFDQGPVSYVGSIALAKQRGIVVNTIHAGPYAEGLATHWQTGAQLAGGRFMSIDANQQIVHVAAPQDAEIAALNARLNETYVPYGAEGGAARKRQIAQDANSESISGALLSKRAEAKASALYESSTWDLVDAVEKDKLALDRVKPEDLPEKLRAMREPELATFVESKSKARKEIQGKIRALGAERASFVAEEQRKAATPELKSLDTALTEAVVEQGRSKGFTFEPTAPKP